MKNKKYSVVIASIGRSCLNLTLNDIIHSSKLPSEVIIVLPHKSEFVLERKYEECGVNIYLLYANKGQVKQRNVGLLNCNFNIIVQLDDDIRFNTTLLECLVNEVSKNHERVVAPLFFSHDSICKTGTEVTRNIFLRFVFGADSEKESLGMGYISKIGLAMRPSFQACKDLIQSDWLPGGCMAYHKQFAEIDPHFLSPEGKFYGEDIINTCHMKDKGAELFFATKLTVYTEFGSPLKIKDVLSHFKSMIYIQNMTQRENNYSKTLLFCFLRFLNQIRNRSY